jgi:hypothetical protein
LFVTYSHHLLLHGLLIHHLPTFCHLLPSPSSSWPIRSSLVCFLIAYFHHFLPCNLLVHPLPTFSSLAYIVSSLFVACLRLLLIAYLHTYSSPLCVTCLLPAHVAYSSFTCVTCSPLAHLCVTCLSTH